MSNISIIHELPDELWSLWKHHAADLYRRDGGDARFPHGGHDIVNNEALRGTLEDLAKRYLPMYTYKFGLLNRQVILNDALLNDDTCDIDKTLTELGEIAITIEEFDMELVGINVSSIRTLLREGSGLDEEAQREARTSPAARRSIAVNLLAPVIKYAVAAACEYSGYNAQLATHPTLVEALKGFVPIIVGSSKRL